MTDHMVEEWIGKYMGTKTAKLSADQVIHLAFCEECSRLLGAMSREYEGSAVPKHTVVQPDEK
jgi:hypothetical protein